MTGHYKRGRTIFSAIDETWRWRRYAGEPLFQSYWLQMCRMLYRNKALGQSKQIELAAETDRVEVGRPLRVTMEVRDPTLLGQIPALVPVLVTDKSGAPVESITLERSGTDQTKWNGVTTAAQVGEFTLQVKPGFLPGDSGVSKSMVTVEPPQREFEKIGADFASLSTIAAKSSGRVVALPHEEELAKEVPDRSVPVLVSNTEELWYKPIALVLVITLATVEWLLRKSAGLV